MSTMKALRPPLAASPVTYLVRFRCPRDSSKVRARFAALPGGWRSRIEPGSLVSRRSKLPACSHVGVSGTSQVSRRPVLCLCPGLGSRPNRQHLAIDGAVDVAPAIPDTKASADFHIETTAGLQHLLPTLQEQCCHHPCKARFRLAG